MKPIDENLKKSIQDEVNSINDLIVSVIEQRDEAFRDWRSLGTTESRRIYLDYCEQEDKYRRQISELSKYLQEQMYISLFLYSDVKAYEVVEVLTIDHLLVRQLSATIKPEAKEALQKSFVPGGFCGHFDNSQQEWSFESNENNPVVHVRRHKDGRFYEAHARTCPYILQDKPYEFRDYNF